MRTEISAALFIIVLLFAVMPYNSAHHCVVEVENFLLLLGGEDQWNPNGKKYQMLIITKSLIPL